MTTCQQSWPCRILMDRPNPTCVDVLLCLCIVVVIVILVGEVVWYSHDRLTDPSVVHWWKGWLPRTPCLQLRPTPLPAHTALLLLLIPHTVTPRPSRPTTHWPQLDNDGPLCDIIVFPLIPRSYCGTDMCANIGVPLPGSGTPQPHAPALCPMPHAPLPHLCPFYMPAKQRMCSQAFAFLYCIVCMYVLCSLYCIVCICRKKKLYDHHAPAHGNIM